VEHDNCVHCLWLCLYFDFGYCRGLNRLAATYYCSVQVCVKQLLLRTCLREMVMKCVTVG